MRYNNLEIQWKGHDSFYIHNSKKIFIDPYKLTLPYQADIILITHSHFDHCSIPDLEKISRDGTVIISPTDCQSKLSKINKKIIVKILQPGEEIELDSIKIKAIPAYNINKQFHNKEDYWNGYLLDIHGTKIYHAGDTDFIPEMNNLIEDHIDIAFLPIDGKYTMTPEEASRAAFIIKPKIALPMHYAELSGNIDDAKKFVSLCKEQGINAEILEKR